MKKEPIQAEPGGVARENAAWVNSKVSPRILHVMVLEKFIPPFIDFIEQHFKEFEKHIFFVFDNSESTHRWPLDRRPNIVLASNYSKLKRWVKLVHVMNRSDKIILHGLSMGPLTKILSLQPWLLEKCYWIMWGYDLYFYQRKRNIAWFFNYFFRRIVIQRIGNLVGTVKGDYELAQEWYGARGKYQECLVYLSNVYQPRELPPKTGRIIIFLVGNSADPSNNHLEIFEKLIPYKDENIRIYCPLSYGDTTYAQAMAAQGKKLFNNKFIPLLQLMSYESYQKLLAKIDIAIFAHKRQQAMGNIINLLGLGVKVHMRSDLTSSRMLYEKGICIYPLEDINISKLDDAVSSQNRAIIEKSFSIDICAEQITLLFS